MNNFGIFVYISTNCIFQPLVRTLKRDEFSNWYQYWHHNRWVNILLHQKNNVLNSNSISASNFKHELKLFCIIELILTNFTRGNLHDINVILTLIYKLKMYFVAIIFNVFLIACITHFVKLSEVVNYIVKIWYPHVISTSRTGNPWLKVSDRLGFIGYRYMWRR